GSCRAPESLFALRGYWNSLAPGSSPVSRVAPRAPTGELLPSPIADGKGQPSTTLHQDRVGVDRHWGFSQVCSRDGPGCESTGRYPPFHLAGNGPVQKARCADSVGSTAPAVVTVPRAPFGRRSLRRRRCTTKPRVAQRTLGRRPGRSDHL